MNAMIDTYMKNEEKKVLEKDMLFATLDTTVRRINTGNNRDFLLSDTVGFLHKLPHGLVKAFRSTLSEVLNADLLLHVVDYSDEGFREQMNTTKETLNELGAGEIPVITVFNKADQCADEISYPQTVGEDKIYISAKDGSSLKALTEMVLNRVYADYQTVDFLIPYEKGNVLSYFMDHSHVLEKKYEEKGTWLRVKCHRADMEKYAGYVS